MTPAFSVIPERAEPKVLAIPGREETVSEGLRISTDCHCRRVREYVAKDEYFPFPPELAVRGWLAEKAYMELETGNTLVPDLDDADEVERWRPQKLHPKADDIAYQLVVPWEFGESHLDIANLTHRRMDELKCNKHGDLAEENIRQVVRQLYVVTLAAEGGDELLWDHEREVSIRPSELLEFDWRIKVMHPELPILYNPDGYRVHLTPDKRAQLDDVWELQRAIMDDLPAMRERIHDPSVWPVCTCSQCFVQSSMPVQNYRTQELMSLYVHARDEVKTATVEKDLVADELKQLIPRGGQPLEGNGLKATHSEVKGRVTYQTAQAIEALGWDATLREMVEAGYSKVGKPSGTLNVTPVKAK